MTITEQRREAARWQQRKRSALQYLDQQPEQLEHTGAAFQNEFALADIGVFDDDTIRALTARDGFAIDPRDLALCLGEMPEPLRRRIVRLSPREVAGQLQQAPAGPDAGQRREQARSEILDRLFWELTYWKTPALYEDLTEGEHLHPEIFRRIDREVRGKVVLDAGAGSGRATFACVRHGASRVYAVEPSAGLLQMLSEKVESSQRDRATPIVPLRGRFGALPLDDNSVDTAIACSAFTSDPAQGGEPGLEELRRVVRPGGTIIIIWPSPDDFGWLAEHGFHYEAVPVRQEMRIRFRSLRTALRCARRFYARNRDVLRHLVRRRRPELPYSVLGVTPPHDYCWLRVS